MNIENRKDKKVMKFIKPVNGGQLMTELYEELPELKPKLEDGELTVNLRMFTREDEVTLWVPNEIDETVVEAVVDKHQVTEIKESEVKDNAISRATL